MNSPLDGKVALITGAGTGIGLYIARMLAQEGVHLVLNARTESKLLQAKSDILTEINPDTQISIFPANVSNAKAVEDMVEHTVQTFGRIDILINNAGVCPEFRLLQELKIQDIDETIDTNLKGAIYLMKYVVPHMVHHGGGTIININSIAGKVVYPYSSVYCATKFGLSAMTESISLEQRNNNIKVVGIYPGEVDTPIWERIEPGIKQNPEKMLDSENIAQAVRYVLMQPEKVFVKDITLLPSHPPEH